MKEEQYLYRYTSNGEKTFSVGRRLLDDQPKELVDRVLTVVKSLFKISRPSKTIQFRAKNKLESEPYRDMVSAKRSFVAEYCIVLTGEL